MKQYFVVNFLETNEVDVISSEWIEGNLCYWPPYKFSKLKKAILQHETPKPSWNTFNFKVISSYSSYAKARKALSKAENTSDINSDTQDFGRGQRKKRKVDHFLSSSDEEDTNFTLPPMPAVPLIEQRNEENEVSTDKNIAEKSNSEFQAMVLRELKVIKSICRQNGELTDSLLNIVNKINVEGNKENKVASEQLSTLLPLQNMAQMEGLEKELQENPAAIGILKNKLKIIGGINFDNMVRRILRNLMEDSLAAQFSWLGSKGKRPFSSLESVKCIFDAVRSNTLFFNKLDSDIELLIRNWLRHAPARCKQDLKL